MGFFASFKSILTAAPICAREPLFGESRHYFGRIGLTNNRTFKFKKFTSKCKNQSYILNERQLCLYICIIFGSRSASLQDLLRSINAL